MLYNSHYVQLILSKYDFFFLLLEPRGSYSDNCKTSPDFVLPDSHFITKYLPISLYSVHVE
jgi:hypothetical protein